MKMKSHNMRVEEKCKQREKRRKNSTKSCRTRCRARERESENFHEFSDSLFSQSRLLSGTRKWESVACCLDGIRNFPSVLWFWIFYWLQLIGKLVKQQQQCSRSICLIKSIFTRQICHPWEIWNLMGRRMKIEFGGKFCWLQNISRPHPPVTLSQRYLFRDS